MASADDPQSRSAAVPRQRVGLPPSATEMMARAQRLVDSRPPGPYDVKWCAEAYHVGDARAIVMVALANRTD